MKTDPLCKYCIISQQDIDFLAVQGMDFDEIPGVEGEEAPEERPVKRRTSAGPCPLGDALATDLNTNSRLLFFVDGAG